MIIIEPEDGLMKVSYSCTCTTGNCTSYVPKILCKHNHDADSEGTYSKHSSTIIIMNVGSITTILVNHLHCVP